MRRAAFACLAVAVGCGFNPDVSRYQPCAAQGKCPPGFLCSSETLVCLPGCGEHCADGGQGGGVGGGSGDAGEDGGVDAGTPLALAAQALPAAVETRPWAHGFVPTGGAGGYHFSLDGGAPGFSLDVGGTLSTSAAPVPGIFPFAISVEDDSVPRQRVTTGFSLTVQPLLRVASPTELVEGRQGSAYVQELQATGGVAPYTFALDGGALPPGVTLDGGSLEGTPTTTAGSPFSFVLLATDSASPPQTAARQVSVAVKVLDTLLVVATPAAADGRVGTAYTQTLKAYGGVLPYAWTVTAGALPPGLSLVDTGTVGRIAGTPTDAGTYGFTVRCTDGVTPKNQVLSILVNP